MSAESLPVLVPKDAATVMLVRDDPELEVFMLRRNLDSVWIAGASVFPGGAVDDDDREVHWHDRCAGWDDRRASAAVEATTGGGLGFFVGAVRETFEEAGVLLARDRSGDPVDGAAAVFAAARDALNAGEISFGDLVAAHDLHLATDELHVVSHWVTPPGGPRRYSTWFFVAAAPPGAYAHDDSELIASRWVRPVDALAADDAGEIELILPTRRNLELLATFPSTAELLAAVRTPEVGVRPLVEHSGFGRRVALTHELEGGGPSWRS